MKKWYTIAIAFLLYDLFAIYFSYWIALYVSYKCNVADIPSEALADYFTSLPFFFVACVILFGLFKLYNSVWRFVSYYELFNFTLAILLTVSLYYSLGALFSLELPLRYYFIGGWMQLWLILTSRFFYRFMFYLYLKTQFFGSERTIKRRGLLIGAGAAGQIILRDIFANRGASIEIRCIIDDDPNLKNFRLSGVPVVGGRDDILLSVKKYGIEEILFAIPTISAHDKRDILNICKEAGCKIRILPGICSLVNGDVSLAQMREVTIDELLGRDQINVNISGIVEDLKDKVVIVTGGGGSIGSELSRQIAKHSPRQLIILDIYENNAYDIEQELKNSHPDLNLKVLIGSVRDTRRLQHIFSTYNPEIVFHAAAHKHVPLMENSPNEAIKNNVLGTYKTAYAAMCCGSKRFVLISTDKAVNPTNIMGASKRLCEMVVQTLNTISQSGNYELLNKSLSQHGEGFLPERLNINEKIETRTEFVAVRFGNVLGSNGSVIPLFKKQIANGGPLTVTHPDIIRYFMTIPEAASLVLEAATYAKGGEIFVLDMGAPVKIDDLARNFIKLCGYTPDVDIKIEYSGLRPGEKLFEEKLMSEEGLNMTPNKLIHVARPLNWNIEEFLSNLSTLAQAAYANEGNITELVKEMVPTYKKSNSQ